VDGPPTLALNNLLLFFFLGRTWWSLQGAVCSSRLASGCCPSSTVPSHLARVTDTPDDLATMFFFFDDDSTVSLPDMVVSAPFALVSDGISTTHETTATRLGKAGMKILFSRWLGQRFAGSDLAARPGREHPAEGAERPRGPCPLTFFILFIISDVRWPIVTVQGAQVGWLCCGGGAVEVVVEEDGWKRWRRRRSRAGTRCSWWPNVPNDYSLVVGEN
jgi:hypothetical protein